MVFVSLVSATPISAVVPESASKSLMPTEKPVFIKKFAIIAWRLSRKSMVTSGP